MLVDEENPEVEKRALLVNTIGNLTLLTHPLNSSLQNSGWDVKRPEITKQSSLALNRELLDIEVWDDNEIMQRQGKLLEIAVIVWPR